MAYNGEGTIYIPFTEFWEFVSKYHDLKGAETCYDVPRVDGEDLAIDVAFSTDDDPSTWLEKPKALLQWEQLKKQIKE